jgi:hypothetical protein
LRRELEAGDARECAKAWAKIAPHLPQPKDDAEAEATMHYARTLAESVQLRARAYSHRWLADRGLPSGLPDHLKPSAERLYPTVAASVGIFVKPASEITRPVMGHVRDAMSGAVLECYADGHKDEPAKIRGRMFEARAKTLKQLVGIR